MSDEMARLAVEAERVGVDVGDELSRPRRATRGSPVVEGLPAHQFPAKAAQRLEETNELSSTLGAADLVASALAAKDEARATSLTFESRRADQEDRDRERRTYRGRTVAMLRRYLRYSIEAGRLPSMLGSEFFRAKVTAYTVVTFEDRVIFVHDMETCLERLDDFSRQLIARHILQEHDQAATGRLLGCTERTVRTHIPVVLDLFSEILLEVGLMERLDSIRTNTCQEGENDQIAASDCEDGKYKV
jgi:hypothetical protein